MILVITTAHIGSILWHSLGLYQEYYYLEEGNWLKKLLLNNSEWDIRYYYSFYWAVTTMTTVGYGDITAQNKREAFFISVCMILFSCVFAYSINNIGMILQDIEKNQKELNFNLSTIKRYLNRKKVNNQLKSRIKSYLLFLSEETKEIDKQSEELILSKLPNKLNEELKIEINRKIINQQAIFSNNFSNSTIKKTIFIMQEIIVLPNEIILKEDELDDQSIYFIENGNIEIFY